jgi:uncharacterized protein YbbC (DUF1343 family)
MSQVATGLASFLNKDYLKFKGAKLGLLCNQASVSLDYRHAIYHLDRIIPGSLQVIFSPQHGFMGEKQDNMVESEDGSLKDGRRVYSLYGETRKPLPHMLEDLDAVLVDLPDLGTRVYTFSQTLFLFMKEAAKTSLPIVVLDRPNPIGGRILEGNLLDPKFSSFVGMALTPMRHGFTLGEYARYAFTTLLKREGILKVVPLTNWNRDKLFSQTGLPWVLPSPNMPSPETALLYPGTVIFEGTNLSEGRGTVKPFHLIGAPYIDPSLLAKELRALNLKGVAFRETFFLPTFNKHMGKLCGGVEIHPTDPYAFRPFLTALSILEIVLKLYPHDFQLKDPPYEYECVKRPIDLILGSPRIFNALHKGQSAKELCQDLEAEIEGFRLSPERQEALLYPK